MSPKSRAHVIAGKRVYELLRDALREKASVYNEAPLAAHALDSEAEPDVLVCSNPDEWAYRTSRTKSVLVVEVSDSSLEYDLGEKAALYPEAGVPEYWVLNLIERVLVVFREPLEGSYRVRFSLQEKDRVSPQAWTDRSFEVGSFLPPVDAARPHRDPAPIPSLSRTTVPTV